MTPADNFSIELTSTGQFTIYSHFGPRRRVAIVDTYRVARDLADTLSRRVYIVTRAVANYGSFKAFSVPGVDLDDTTNPSAAKRRAHARALDLAQTMLATDSKGN